MDDASSRAEPHVPERGCDGDKDGSGCSRGDGGCRTQRRKLLAVMSGAATASVAGCVGLFEEPDQSPDNTPVDGSGDGNGDGDEDGGEDGDSDDGTDEDGQSDATEHDIEFLEQEETIPVAEDEELLYAGLDEGWDLPFQCEIGVCGQCTARVDGDGSELVEMSNNEYLDDEQVAGGYVLTCTGQPREEFAIETGMKDEADEFEPGEETEEQADVEEYDIEFVKEGETIPVAADEELLYAGLDEGWDLPYQCEQGICGQCTARVDGDGSEFVEMSNNEYLDDEQVADGYVLTCTGQPREEFAIETSEKP